MITAYDAYGVAIAQYNDDGTLLRVLANSDGTSRTTTDTPKVPTTNTGGGKFWDGVTFNSVLKSAGDLLKSTFPDWNHHGGNRARLYANLSVFTHKPNHGQKRTGDRVDYFGRRCPALSF